MHRPLIIDIEGTELTALDKTLLSHPWVGGVILFQDNFVSHAQIQALIQQIYAIKSPRLLVMVDHEGGRVQRFQTEFTHLPAMRRLGEYYESEPTLAMSLARACGQVMAAELIVVGIDLSLAPVLDLDHGKSEIIGSRSFHSTPQGIVDLAGSLIEGLHAFGMKAVGKHFPGHGGVVLDSHLAYPCDERSFETLWEQDMLPFRRLAPQLDAVMTAHVRYEQVDPAIATYSTHWLNTVLRQQLGFKGAVISDALNMQAACVIAAPEQRIQAALDAGCDYVLVCKMRDFLQHGLLNGTMVLPTRSAPVSLYAEPLQTPQAQALYQHALHLLTSHSLIK